ncbi:hypothetical protein [Desulforegula conservatrix]|uniref:hypothetical protein n=1 Tax=Desulforegula conservatrix TaxID=153026 RepID=UPI00040FE9E9|nr:hypothetical protein [Desulforegula conservatrix]
MDKGRYKGLPQDENGKPIMSSPEPHLTMITTTDAWVDITVSAEHECKSLLAIVHSGDFANFSNSSLGLEFHWRPSADYAGMWAPLTSGPLPFCAKGGGGMGQVYLQTGTALSLIML